MPTSGSRARRLVTVSQGNRSTITEDAQASETHENLPNAPSTASDAKVTSAPDKILQTTAPQTTAYHTNASTQGHDGVGLTVDKSSPGPTTVQDPSVEKHIDSSGNMDKGDAAGALTIVMRIASALDGAHQERVELESLPALRQAFRIATALLNPRTSNAAGHAMVEKVIKLRIKAGESKESLTRKREEVEEEDHEGGEEKPTKKIRRIKVINRQKAEPMISNQNRNTAVINKEGGVLKRRIKVLSPGEKIWRERETLMASKIAGSDAQT